MQLLEWLLFQWMSKPYVPDPDESGYPCWDRGYFYPHSKEIVKEAQAIVKRWIKDGWMWQDSHGNYRLTPEKRKLAAATPRPDWTPPAPAPLTAFDMEVLGELEAQSRVGGSWVTPMHCGGRNGSGHSTSLLKLAQHGYARRRSSLGGVTSGVDVIPKPHLFKRAKGSNRYQITDAGRAFLKSPASLS